ncbi:MAG: plasmid mobilization relaxosome protein MobC, partial [Eubacteriales bacterium]|nr:plasmid mobilization relaxosome protein MobC [Eubacteriales bacterium]
RKEKVSQKKRKQKDIIVRKENYLGRSQTETITIRVTPEEKHSMQGKMYEAVAPSMREFILRMCADGKIVVNSDLRELNQELRYQGNNLNQLTKLCHQGRISAVDLSELLSVYRQILFALGGENDGCN